MHSAAIRHPIWFVLRRLFVFQQVNDPKYTSRLWKGYLTKKKSDGVLHQITWPPQSPNLNPIEMVWDELDIRVKEKQPTSAQHMWKLLQDCWKSIPGEACRECQECAKLSSRQRVATLKNLKYQIYLDLFNTFFGYYMIPYVLFYSVDVFSIILQCRK